MNPKEYGQQPAFPIETDYKISNGITKREWFAAHVEFKTEIPLGLGCALAGPLPELLPNGEVDYIAMAQWGAKSMAKIKFVFADAMIAASLE